MSGAGDDTSGVRQTLNQHRRAAAHRRPVAELPGGVLAPARDAPARADGARVTPTRRDVAQRVARARDAARRGAGARCATRAAVRSARAQIALAPVCAGLTVVEVGRARQRTSASGASSCSGVRERRAPRVCRGRLVDGAVTVLVGPAADLGAVHVDVGVGVVAIGRVLDRVAPRSLASILGDRGGIAVTVQIRVGVEVAEHALIRHEIAVVVTTVTHLDEARIDVRAPVVAIVAAMRSVRVEVAAPRVDVPVHVAVSRAERGGIAVLVVVLQVADLGVSAEAVGVGVIAVVAPTLGRVVTIAVGVANDRAVGDTTRSRLVARLSG